MPASNCAILPKACGVETLDFKERIPQTPPVIAPVAAHCARPKWSVMIPAYNCLNYLRETLQCVLVQDAGPDHMQIVVVDDCSTDGDVHALVQAIGGARVDYFRQEENKGSLRNFETCLNLATGYWVHILHGDDLVKPGFYAEIEKLFNQFPAAGAAFTNVAHISSSNQLLYVYDRLLTERGVIKDFAVRNAQRILVQPPAIVVKRSVYEQVGGFYAAHYGEDWEMWTRIGAYFPIAYSPKYLASYRYYVHNSITQNSILTGQNIPDLIKVIDIMQKYIPVNQRTNIRRIARRECALYCVSLAYLLYRTNRAAAVLQLRGALQLSQDIKVYNALGKILLSSTLSAIKTNELMRFLRPATDK